MAGVPAPFPSMGADLATEFEACIRLRRMQYRPGLIEGFLSGTALNLTPFCNLRN
jgi:hypothetical protein